MQQYSGHAGGGGLISRHIGWIGGELIKLLQSKFVSKVCAWYLPKVLTLELMHNEL